MNNEETRNRIFSEVEIWKDTILQVMQDKSFGMTESSTIVGGEARLKRLIAEGKIQTTKPNRKWFCNAADVLRYAKIRNKSNHKR